MALEVNILDKSDPKKAQRWDAYVREQAAASGYHQFSWKTVVEQVYEYKSYYLYVEEDGEIVGILPLVQVPDLFFSTYLVSLPFTTYGGLVADHPEVISKLIGAAGSLAKSLKSSYVEFRHFGVAKLPYPTKTHKVSMWLDLPSSADILWNGFQGEVRTGIRKSLKEGVVVRIGGAEELENFYSMFSRNMRDLGTPTYSKSFFATIIEEWSGTKRIATAYHHEKPVASGMMLGFGDKIEMPWASSLREAKSLCPNMLLYWECLRYAIHSGFSCFDFGRSTLDSGPFKFKKQWGAKQVPLYWQYWFASPNISLPQRNPNNPKFAHAIRAWQHLPLWLTQCFGPRIVRFFP